MSLSVRLFVLEGAPVDTFEFEDSSQKQAYSTKGLRSTGSCIVQLPYFAGDGCVGFYCKIEGRAIKYTLVCDAAGERVENDDRPYDEVFRGHRYSREPKNSFKAVRVH